MLTFIRCDFKLLLSIAHPSGVAPTKFCSYVLDYSSKMYGNSISWYKCDCTLCVLEPILHPVYNPSTCIPITPNCSLPFNSSPCLLLLLDCLWYQIEFGYLIEFGSLLTNSFSWVFQLDNGKFDSVSHFLAIPSLVNVSIWSIHTLCLLIVKHLLPVLPHPRLHLIWY